MAVEKLVGIQVPYRAQYIRVMFSEVTRAPAAPRPAPPPVAPSLVPRPPLPPAPLSRTNAFARTLFYTWVPRRPNPPI